MPRSDKLDVATRKKLREEGKCFYCKKAWEPKHRCLGKGQVHFIEVYSEESSRESKLKLSEGLDDSWLMRAEGTLGSMVASLHGVRKFVALKLIGQACGQDIMVMINPRASHNFIDINFAERKDLKTKGFEGFRVSNANGKLKLVDRIMEKLGVKLQRYVVKEDFYLYPLKGHPHIILGVQWLFELGDIHTNYQNLNMRFEIGEVEHTLHWLKDEDALKTNNRLELVELAEGGKRLAMLGIHVNKSPMLDMRMDRVTTLCHGVSGMTTSNNVGDWDPTLDQEPPRDITLRGQGGGDPTLSIGKARTLARQVQEFSNPTLRIREAITAKDLPDRETGLGPIHFMLTIIFRRFLPVRFSVGMHALTWLKRFFHEHILRKECHGQLRSLQFAEVFSTRDSPQTEEQEVTMAFQGGVV